MNINLQLVPPTFEISHDFGTHLMIGVPASMTIGEFRENSLQFTKDIDRVCKFDLGWITIKIRPEWSEDDLFMAHYHA